jgi:methylmalonyl-CoA/ethylmalonyl-CoA epimerase
MTPTLEFDHLGIIVPNLTAGREFLANTLGITHWTALTDDPGLRVSVQFGIAPPGSLQNAGPTYELVAPLGDDSPIANALRQGKHILNHVAYTTPNLDLSAAHLRDQGCYPTADPHPALAYDGCRIQFWLSPLRFVLELVEKPNHRHMFVPDPAA